ncbi:MAG: polysaccharide deacetylase [Bacteroidetes bacterium]|nr:polysaccharide deacetylase [Bacteroidota bacterium]
MNKHIATNVIFFVALMCLFFLNTVHAIGWYWYAIPIFLYLLVSSIGSYFIQLNYFTHSYCSGDRNKPQIAITFDDGPNDHTAKVLDILKVEKVPATFFCIGQRIKSNESTLSRIQAEGHLIGNHSFGHKTTFPLQSSGAIAKEIQKCSEAIRSVIHKRPLLFRPPFGVTDPMVASGIKRSGMYSIGWSLRSYDTVIASSDKLLQKLNTVSNGDVILFHEAGLQTANVLSQFIKNARAKGFEIIPLDQLLGIQPYEK